MVYSIAYQPKPDSYPRAEQIGGDTDKMKLEDATWDGGVCISGGTYFSGRRLRTDNAPKLIKWLSNRALLDYEETRMRNVSEYLRGIIECIEPDTHQFIPVEFVSKDGSIIERRFLWQVCNRIDSVHREATNWHLSENGVSWLPPTEGCPHLVFDLTRVGRRKFWHDKHLSHGPFITDDVKHILDESGVTGLRYAHIDQI